MAEDEEKGLSPTAPSTTTATNETSQKVSSPPTKDMDEKNPPIVAQKHVAPVADETRTKKDTEAKENLPLKDLPTDNKAVETPEPVKVSEEQEEARKSIVVPRASVKVGDHVTIDIKEHEIPEDDIKVRWNMRRTAEKPCLCCCQLCGCWIFMILLLVVLGAAVASIEFSLDVPFYDRSEINQQREDAYAATVERADFLSSFMNPTEAEGLCVHDDPTILTRNGTLVQGPAPSKSCQRSTSMKLRLLYISKDRKTNILTPENLKKIKAIEDRILNHREFPRYCNLIDSQFPVLTTRDFEQVRQVILETSDQEPEFTPCERIYSPVDFLDPMYFDIEDETGLGYHLMAQDQFPQEFNFTDEQLDKVVKYWSNFTTRSYNLSDYDFAVATVGGQVTVFNYLFQSTSSDYRFGSTEAIGVTSSINLGLPIDGYESASEEADDQYADIGQWLWDEFDSFLKDAGFDGVEVYWSDSEQAMESAELGDLAIKSMSLFPLSVIGVLLYLIIMQDSIFIGFAGILQIILSFVPALILYRYIFGEDYLGVLNIISFYIILGVGVDDIFVFTDQYKLTRGEPDFSVRMQKTFNTASKAMFTTSCTTFISFVSNASSVFPAVATFGLFSALLILVNFCAVTTFFPAVYSVYCTRISQIWWDHPSLLFRCKKGPPEDAQDEGEHSESGFSHFFKNKWAPLVIKLRYVIILIFGAILVAAIVITTGLEPDENAPTTLPEDNNYRQYVDVLLDYFQKTENPTATRVRWVSGIDPDSPIDRSGTDDTDVGDYGSPNYLDCSTFNPTTPAAQVWALKTCHDLFFSNVTEYHGGNEEFGMDGPKGAKARNMINELVQPDVINYYTKLDCPTQGFRDWLLTDSGCEKLQGLGLPCHAETSIRPNCITWDTEGNSCEPFPVPAENWVKLMAFFIQDPATDPRTQATNYEKYSHLLFVDKASVNENIVLPDDFSCRTGTSRDSRNEDLVMFAMASEAVTTEGFAMDYNDGIDLYNRWDAWASQMRKFVPREMAGTYQSSNGSWAFYFLNETLLSETFSGIGLALGLGFLVLTIVGGNIVMAALSVLTIIMIVVDVFAFTVLAGYYLGVVEAVLYVVVIGLSIDYSVHMSEAYTESHAETRVQKVTLMLEEMGVSVLSGALSTLIAAFFMFFAPNTFFVKFAAFLFVTIALSCIYALVFYPALLAVIGPLGNTGMIYERLGRLKNRFIHEFTKAYIQSKDFARREMEVKRVSDADLALKDQSSEEES